jgi:Tfp pilus assembly protein PilW
MQLKSPPSSPQLGLGLVELMVGITVGLIVTAGASMVAVNQINEHRRLTLETQVQQDLRSAADIIQQDIRRIGFRGNSELGVWAPERGTVDGSYSVIRTAQPSPYNDVGEERKGQSGTQLNYSYALTDTQSKYTNNSLDTKEKMGLKWDSSNKALYVQLGVAADGTGNWQPITDPQVVEIVDFSITVFEQQISVGDFCDTACVAIATPAGSATCPQQLVRRVEFTIIGQAKHDANVRRTISSVEFIRSNGIIGACPL